ncbi:MAG: 2-C-methyl-D-erythritol 2,4-cyclodiphosphate synthase [Candidatus Lambdaproteobacteria bacterium]|nr:2-C-methyl-D-erythritol 2,4-cyclodiphosphate synthase [Candidatus Lambdaproteobacteria bacterium]
MPAMRIGIGYDVHRLEPGRPLMLGGVHIPHPLGLAGHSDADVLLHAVGDALLGAAAKGDLGRHFPPGDPATAGIESSVLLRRIVALLDADGWRAVNVDATVIAERPRLAPHVPAMRDHIATLLRLTADAVSVKATTTEGLGWSGREEGMGAQAVVLIERD